MWTQTLAQVLCRGGWATAFAMSVAACSVVTYQPVSGLSRPTAISAERRNFEGRRMVLRCLPGGYLDPRDTQRLCARVQALFAGQGAEVQMALTRAGTELGGPPAQAGAVDLVLELRSRLLHEERNVWLSILSGLSLTLIPAISSFSFAQDVVVLDADGFQLASETLEGRFVTYFGAGVWSVNKVLDLLVREEDEHLTGDTAKTDFSKDFYRQLSQIALNAHLRARVMRAFDEPPRPNAPPRPPLSSAAPR